MCLIIKENKELITKEYLGCYKILYKASFFGGFSENFLFHYIKFKKQKIINFVLRNNYDQIKIYEGYHSYDEKSKFIKIKNEKDLDLFIIPKNTKYYKGFHNIESDTGYCSESIIYIGKNNSFNRWIAKIFYNVNFKKNGI